jgi:hypothetical protein
LRDERGQIEAGLPVYTVASWLLGNRTVSVPFATMCDPLISTKEQFSLLWPAIEDASEKQGVRRIEIRTRRIRIDCIPALLTASKKYKHHYVLLGEPTDAIFHSFHKNSIRLPLEKAKRAGVVMEKRPDEQSLRVLHDFLVATRRRHSLPPIPFAFFQAMHRWLGPDRVAIYLAMHACEPVGGLLVLKFKDLWTAEYSGTADNAIPGIGPLFYWEAIQHAKSSGAACFSFGRTSLDNTGLLVHKRRWATIEENMVDFISRRGSTSAQGQGSREAGGLALYRNAVRLLVRYTPPAVQKSLGDFCYRHLG